jgi:hypothetical protein
MRRLCLVALFLLLAGVLFAVPYASQIKVSKSQIPSGGSLDISYFVNEAGGTATIEIVEEANPSNVAATFAGTATLGSNTVSWDGTNNNAGGTPIADGDYRVKITIAASNPAAWTEIASNSSLGNWVLAGHETIYHTLWDGFSGMEMLITHNPDLDSFGYILCSTSYSTPRIDGHVVFNPDLSCYDGGDGSSTWLNFPGTPSNNQGVWGNCFDPQDPNDVWVVGQDETVPPIIVMRGRWNASTLTDVTNTNTGLIDARDVAVAIEGSSKYAYITRGYAEIWKCDVTNNVVETTPAPFNILNLSDVNRYSKGVDLDENGNLYWSSRCNETTNYTGGAIYRWDRTQIEGVAPAALTEANATWNIQFPTGAVNVEGIAIDRNGDVYAACASETAADGSLRGIYLIGNVSQGSNNKTLTTSDRVYALYDTGQTFSGFGFAIAADYAGNICWVDRGNEQIRCVSPGGTTSVSVLGPTSQSFFVGIVSARNWILYE